MYLSKGFAYGFHRKFLRDKNHLEISEHGVRYSERIVPNVGYSEISITISVHSLGQSCVESSTTDDILSSLHLRKEIVVRTNCLSH